MNGNRFIIMKQHRFIAPGLSQGGIEKESTNQALVQHVIIERKIMIQNLIQ